MQTRSGNPWHSLERKLPMLIGGLVALLLATALGSAHYEVRQSAIHAADERLQRVAGQIGDWIDAAIAARERIAEGVAADPAVLALFDPDGGDELAAHTALERLRLRADTDLIVRVYDTTGGRLLDTGPAEPVAATVETTGAAVSALDAVAYGPLFVSAGTGHYWVTIPVRRAGRTIGRIDHLRHVANPVIVEQLEPLIGARADLFLANRGGGPWVALDGSWLDTPDAPPVDRVFQHRRADGEHYAFARALRGSDWLLIVDTPMHHALASTRLVARRVLSFGALLLLLGGLAAWLVSRSVTAPLRRLGSAVDAIAAGDYTRRTGLDRSDEIGHLARSFDVMAGQVEATHFELEHRFNEARALAAELKDANARLQLAVRETEVARRDAQDASRAKSDFLATISHEIRTPINAVIGYTDLLELGLGGPLSEQQQDYVQRIRRSGEHLTALVNDVLDFAKIESGQMRVESEIHSAPAAINAVISMLHARARERRLDIRAACALTTVYLGDEQRVQQILLNLLSNAIKFTAEGGTITFACERRSSRSPAASRSSVDQHEWTCISVTDTGIGIGADQLERIFEPFVQGRPGYTRTHGGAGLGLAISRSLARMMNGDISVLSECGRGATFTLWLPHPLPAAAAPARSDATDRTARNTRGR